MAIHSRELSSLFHTHPFLHSYIITIFVIVMKRSWDFGALLPDEVMDEIFLRIPPRDLWNRRIVSSSWRRHVRNKNFVNRHFSASKLYNPSLIFVVVAVFHTKSISYNVVYKNDASQTQHLTIFKAHHSLISGNIPEIVDVCHAIVCLIYEEKFNRWNFAVCNSATSKIIRIDYPIDNEFRYFFFLVIFLHSL